MATSFAYIPATHDGLTVVAPSFPCSSMLGVAGPCLGTTSEPNSICSDCECEMGISASEWKRLGEELEAEANYFDGFASGHAAGYY